ncbi:hypothetical protein RI367_003288 [Sorochytrium milnesiophthora]
MPCILKIRVVSARDLPVMDRSSELADAFVEVRFGEFDPLRTAIARKTLNPVWNEDFRFEVSDDAVLQNEPVEIRVLDYDTITANDPVGAVLLDLDPLLQFESVGQISGWFPLYDSLRGIRGQINVQVKLQYFGDVNPFKESSAGVQFFAATAVPPCFAVLAMSGLVEGIVSEDDPEFHWSDSFRTPRSSNDARQRLLFRLNGQLRRILGKKVLDLGGNAVIGFRQCYDLENEERLITARAYGTACRIAKVEQQTPTAAALRGSARPRRRRRRKTHQHSKSDESKPARTRRRRRQQQQQQQQVQKQPGHRHHRRGPSHTAGQSGLPAQLQQLQSDEPRLDSGSPLGSDVYPSPIVPPSSYVRNRVTSRRQRRADDRRQQLPEQPVQLLTLNSFPPGSILGIGGIVTAKSVKLLGVEGSKVRDQWWTELREEIKSHAKALNCAFVAGYTETVSIQDELCVLSAIGTALELDTSSYTQSSAPAPSGRAIGRSSSFSSTHTAPGSVVDASLSPKSAEAGGNNHDFDSPKPSFVPAPTRKLSRSTCRMCHIPYLRATAPFPMSFVKCGECKRRYVPEILLSTIEPPAEAKVIGQGSYLEAHICRPKRKKDGESNATIVSDAIPFTEYDLHRQLIYKLRVHGMNAIFGLKTQLTVGEELIVAVASGTAMFLTALPVPPTLKISRNLHKLKEEDAQGMEIQRRIVELSEANQAALEASRRALEQQQHCDVPLSEPAGALPIGAVLRLQQSVSSPSTPPSSSPVTSSTNSPLDSDGFTSTGSDSDLDSDSSGSGGSGSSGDTSSSSSVIFAARIRRRTDSASDTDSDTDDDSSHDDRGGNGTGDVFDETDDDDDDNNDQPRSNLVVQVDDDADEDLMAALLDPNLPEGFYLCSTESLPLRTHYPIPLQGHALELQMITIVKQTTVHPKTNRANRELAAVFREMYDELRFRLSYLSPCIIAGITFDIQIPEESQCQIHFTAMAIGNRLAQDEELFGNSSLLATATSVRAMLASGAAAQVPDVLLNSDPVLADLTRDAPQQSSFASQLSSESRLTPDLMRSIEHVIDQEVMFEMDDEDDRRNGAVARGDQECEGEEQEELPSSVRSHRKPPLAKGLTIDTLPPSSYTSSFAPASSATTAAATAPLPRTGLAPPPAVPFPVHVEMSPLSFIPGTTIETYMGKLSLHFVKEASVTHETATAGMGGFLQMFMSEVFAIVRAHVQALGGNAIVAMQVEQSGFSESVKNQAYALVSVSGDVCRLAGTLAALTKEQQHSPRGIGPSSTQLLPMADQDAPLQ